MSNNGFEIDEDDIPTGDLTPIELQPPDEIPSPPPTTEEGGNG